jgi:hypothetical protein
MNPSSRVSTLLLAIEGVGLVPYWLHVAARSDAKLSELDNLIRRTWVECCGHLSEIRVSGQRFLSYDPEESEAEVDASARRMESATVDVMRGQPPSLYEYDFGTTTGLVITPLDMVAGVSGGERVRLVARNDPPDLRCESCGKRAKLVCATCILEERGLTCKGCARGHDCQEPAFRPLVNSPRAGQCGYTGAESTKADLQDGLALMLLYISAFQEGPQGALKAWKNVDFDTMDRLAGAGLISDSRGAKSVWFTEEGAKRAEEMIEMVDTAIRKAGTRAFTSTFQSPSPRAGRQLSARSSRR